jgi:gliding motility-associated-like protein
MPVHLKAGGTDKYSWTPSTAVADAGAGITTANPTTTTLYQVVAKDNFNCFTDTGYVNIKVWQYPKVDAGPDKTVSIGTTFLLQPTYSTDIIDYQWNNPLQTLSCVTCPAPTVQTKGAQITYAIKVKNEGGCVSVDEITVYAICNGGNLFIPNTFSPNTDGKNDKFYPRGTGLNQIKSLRIYDRWGEVVFTRNNFNANDPSAGWDGSYKGKPLSPDVYVYTCEVVCMNNEVLIYNGNVTLLK